mmetsp:Transcript_84632/g.218107  ORF Transcript_84632/g.218107 Transcript_84632/m.218107 type:complete len:413 (+) Transcript_84632:1699-2937(+)
MAAADGRPPRLRRPLRRLHVQHVPAPRGHAHVADALRGLRARHGRLRGAAEAEPGPHSDVGVHLGAAQARLRGGLRQGLHLQAEEAGGAGSTQDRRRHVQEEARKVRRKLRRNRWARRHQQERCRCRRRLPGRGHDRGALRHGHGHVLPPPRCHHRRPGRGPGGAVGAGCRRRVPSDLPQGDGRRRFAVQGHHPVRGPALDGHQPRAPAAARVHSQGGLLEWQGARVRGRRRAVRRPAPWPRYVQRGRGHGERGRQEEAAPGRALLHAEGEAHLAAHQGAPLRGVPRKGASAPAAARAPAVRRLREAGPVRGLHQAARVRHARQPQRPQPGHAGPGEAPPRGDGLAAHRRLLGPVPEESAGRGGRQAHHPGAGQHEPGAAGPAPRPPHRPGGLPLRHGAERLLLHAAGHLTL